jgi:cellulose 1,4-beta-cellobiosidase
MDIWEANSASTAFTPHPCNITGPYTCTGTLCGAGSERYDGVCDEDGCDFNGYRLGAQNFYGPKKVVDTTRKFTVVTQFLTNNNRASGELSQIRRLYVQDGRIIQNTLTNVKGISPTNHITDDFCTAEKEVLGGINAFSTQGGLTGIGKALGRGMVLVLSIWDDASTGMLWLDGVYPTTANATSPGVKRGSCSPTSGDAGELAALYPDAAVTFSNIKTGDIGSTYKGWAWRG